MADVKSFLFNYFRQRHFDSMSPEVRARFDDYSKTDDFTGNMRRWKQELVGGSVPGISTHLDADQIEELYMIFQEVLQNMYADKSSFTNDNDLTNFITTWFGDDYKTFNNTKAKNALESAIVQLRVLLEHGKSHGLPTILSTNLRDIFKDGFTYDNFIKGLEKGKYNTDLKFRKKFIEIAEYVDYYGQFGDATTWPRALQTLQSITGNIDNTPITVNLPLKFSSEQTIGSPSTWFEINNKSAKIDAFKTDYVTLFDRLLTSKKIRDSFAEYGSGNTVSKQLAKAIKETDYSNKESNDFVPEKLPDKKNWVQTLQDNAKDGFENYLRKFTNPTHGSRIYFSPWSQNITKALDKVGTKPTDGIEGILKNKDKILEKLKTSATATKHFAWFADTLSDLKSKMPNAFEGALRNGNQMRNLVSAIIVKAVENGKIKEAQTAMEILSISKYGFTTSRTVDAMQKTDFSIVGDKNLSWNKNEGVQFVTNAMDKTAKLAIASVGRLAAGIVNAVQHSKTKISNDIRENKILNPAYKKWQTEDAQKLSNEQNVNAAHNVQGRLNALQAGFTVGGITYQIYDDATLNAVQAVVDSGTRSPADTYILKDKIADYKDAKSRKDLVDNWRSNNKDNYHDLIAYWNMLESYTKTHSFTLGSMKIERDAFLKDWQNGTSKAQNKIKSEIASFATIRAA